MNTFTRNPLSREVVTPEKMSGRYEKFSGAPVQPELSPPRSCHGVGARPKLSVGIFSRGGGEMMCLVPCVMFHIYGVLFSSRGFPPIAGWMWSPRCSKSSGRCKDHISPPHGSLDRAVYRWSQLIFLKATFCPSENCAVHPSHPITQFTWKLQFNLRPQPFVIYDVYWYQTNSARWPNHCWRVWPILQLKKKRLCLTLFRIRKAGFSLDFQWTFFRLVRNFNTQSLTYRFFGFVAPVINMFLSSRMSIFPCHLQLNKLQPNLGFIDIYRSWY